MRKLSEEEKYLLDTTTKYWTPKHFWRKLAWWDIFNPKKRDRFLNGLKAGKNLNAAFKDCQSP